MPCFVGFYALKEMRVCFLGTSYSQISLKIAIFDYSNLEIQHLLDQVNSKKKGGSEITRI